MYPDVPSAPTMTSPATLQLGKSRPHNAEMQESSWEIIRVNNLGAKLTRQKGTPALYFHGRTNKVYTLEGTEVCTNRKTTKESYYRIPRCPTNFTTILIGANTTSSNQRYY
jgi:hypothetical protein